MGFAAILEKTSLFGAKIYIQFSIYRNFGGQSDPLGKVVWDLGG